MSRHQTHHLRTKTTGNKTKQKYRMKPEHTYPEKEISQNRFRRRPCDIHHHAVDIVATTGGVHTPRSFLPHCLRLRFTLGCSSSCIHTQVSAIAGERIHHTSSVLVSDVLIILMRWASVRFPFTAKSACPSQQSLLALHSKALLLDARPQSTQ